MEQIAYILNIIKEFDFIQVIATLVGMSFFYFRLDKKIELFRAELKQDIKDTNKRIDDLTKRVDNLETNLNSRIDALYNLFANFLYVKKDDDRAA